MISLSILIPSFNYVDGVLKILKCLDLNQNIDLEIIISDDSSSNDLSNIMKSYDLKSKNIIYHRNIPSLGAVKN